MPLTEHQQSLTTNGLSDLQLQSFAEHGWILLEGVLTDNECAEYIDALDRQAQRRTPRAFDRLKNDTTVLNRLLLFDDLFYNWFEIPGIVEANTQLIGHPTPRFDAAFAHIKVPHPDRSTSRASLTDPNQWPWWHRAIRPRWGLFPHERDDRLVNVGYVLNVTYLTPISPDNGSTAVLDGSHLLEGTYESLKDQCRVIQPEAPAGSILLFAETLLHSPSPIVSEITRYNMYYGFVLPWFASWPGLEVPQVAFDSLANEDLRGLLSAPFYKRGDQPE